MSGIVIHHLGTSQSERIVWLCEELGLPYRIVRYERDGGMAPEAYRALHPMGLSPVIEADGRTLAESGAIIDYLVARHGGGRLAPSPDHPRYADWLFWHHFANGTMLPAGMIEIMGRMMAFDDGVMALLGARQDRGLAMLEAGLADDEWVAGDEFTTADIMMVFPLTTMRAFAPRDLGPYPNVLAYLARIGARPAYARAMAACEPDMTPLLA